MSPLEQELLLIWQEVLQIDSLSVEDEFEACGGTPALGGQLIERLEKRFGLILHLPWLVHAPSVARQAAWLQARCLDSTPIPEFPPNVPGWREYFRTRFQENEPCPPTRPNPPALFVLSAARTGSTLLRIMLAGHSQLFSPPELELLLFRSMQQRKAGLMGGWSDFLGLERAAMELWGWDETRSRAYVADLLDRDVNTQEVYRELQDKCAPRLLVDKSPSYPLSLPALQRIERWFDQPLYLHLVRHPLACVRSWTASNFDQVFDAPPRQTAEMDWLISNENILEMLAPLPVERYHQVRYEELVSQPQAIMDQLCHFLSIPLEPAMLTPYAGERMTGRISGLVSGDKMFYRKNTIDASAAQRARRLPEDGPLCAETIQLAQTLGYADL